MTDNKLSELEIKLYNATIKFLDNIVEEEKYNGVLDAVIRKSEDKYGTCIGLQSCIPEKINHNCSLKYYENYKNLGEIKINFGIPTESPPYNKKYREFILNEIPECKEMELI